MKKRKPFHALGAFAALALASSLQAELPDLSKMNILFICPEDWSTEAIGAYGNKQVITPNIDQLATRSTLFTKAYCQAPVCNPSRSSFLTGLRPETSGVFGNDDKFEESIPEWATTIGETLKAHSIQTYMIGKLFHHTWEAEKQTNAFDAIFNDPPKGYPGNVLKYTKPKGTPQNPPKNWTYSPNPEWDKKMVEAMAKRKELWSDAEKGSKQWHDGRRVFQDLSAEVVGDSGDIEERNPDGIMARVVANVIREQAQRGQQFFLTFGPSRPHTPLRVPKKYLDMYDPETLKLTEATEDKDRNVPPVAKRFGRNWDLFKIRKATPEGEREALHAYYACATFVDAQIGLVINALEEAGIADKTIVIFTSDHGFHLGEHGMWSKLSLFEQSTRVPFVVKIPGVTKGEVSDAIIELVDLYPTICDILDLPLPHDKLEGVSILPVIEDPKRKWKQAAFTVCKQGKYLGRSVRTHSHRYTEWVEFEAGNKATGPATFVELYDLETDRWEQNNLAGLQDHAQRQQEMANILAYGWQAALPEED